MKKNDENEHVGGYLETFKDKPGMLLLLPSVFLLGIDLLLNMAVLVKRSLDYFLFWTSTEYRGLVVTFRPFFLA